MDRIVLPLFFFFSTVYFLMRYPLFPIMMAVFPLLILIYFHRRSYNLKTKFFPLALAIPLLVNLLNLFYLLMINRNLNEVISYLFKFNTSLALGLAAAGFFLVGLWSLGKLVTDTEQLLNIAIGLFLYQLYLILMLKLGLSQLPLLILPLVLPLIKQVPTIKGALHTLLQREWRLELSSLEIANIIALTLLSAAVLINNVRNFPIDHDGSITYLNNTKIIAQTGKLLSTSLKYEFPYATELALSTVFRIGGVPATTLTLTLFFFLSQLTFLGLLRKIKGGRLSPNILAVTFICPSLIALAIFESKIEWPLIFLFLTSLTAFLKWQEEPSPGNASVLSAVLAVSFSTKLTALYFIVPIFIMVSWNLLARNRSIPKTVISSFLFISLTILFFSPWIFIAHTRALGQTVRTASQPLRGFLEEHREEYCYDRYLNETYLKSLYQGNGIYGRIKQPFDLFLGKLEGGTLDHSDLGPNLSFLLATVPFILILRNRLRVGKTGKDGLMLVPIFLISFFLWYIISHKVIWYALPTFILLPLLTTSLSNLLENNSFLFVATLNSSVIAFFYTLVYPLIISFVPINYTYNDYLKNSVTSFATVEEFKAVEKINLIIKKEPKTIFLRYQGWNLPLFFVDNSNRHVTDSFSIFSDSQNSEQLVERMRNFGITHLIVPRKGGFQSFSCGPNDFSKAKAVVNLTRVVFENSEIGIYELPKDH